MTTARPEVNTPSWCTRLACKKQCTRAACTTTEDSLRLRACVPAQEEGRVAGVVADREYEGPVGAELLWLRLGARGFTPDDHRGRGGSLGALLVHLHEGLVQHVRDEQVLVAGVHPGEVGVAERSLHPQVDQRRLQRVLRFRF